jgi:hypothetical protein
VRAFGVNRGFACLCVLSPLRPAVALAAQTQFIFFEAATCSAKHGPVSRTAAYRTNPIGGAVCPCRLPRRSR